VLRASEFFERQGRDVNQSFTRRRRRDARPEILQQKLFERVSGSNAVAFGDAQTTRSTMTALMGGLGSF
jgi:hypothetical protein